MGGDGANSSNSELFVFFTFFGGGGNDSIEKKNSALFTYSCALSGLIELYSPTELYLLHHKVRICTYFVCCTHVYLIYLLHALRYNTLE
jgi:hypothetical protein